MIATQVPCTSGHMVAKEISTLVSDSLDDLLQWAYGRLGMRFSFVVNIFIEQMLFDLVRGEVMYQILGKHIAEYFDNSNTARKVGESYYSQMPSRHQSLR